MAALAASALFLANGVGAQTIANPSFEAESFGVAPGYISGNRPITGWTASNPNRAGLNPADGSPFAGGGTVPDGANVAFIQSTGIGSTTLSTTLTGLTAGRSYRLIFRANSRPAYTPPIASYSIAGGTPVAFVASPAVEGAAGYHFVAGNFTATSSTASLVIRNETTTAAADSALLVDDFSVEPVDSWAVTAWTDDPTSGISANTSWAYHFGSATPTFINGRSVSGIATGSPAVAGQFAVTGVDQVFPGDANNLTALAGSGSAVVAGDFIWGGEPATVTLQGLTPGAAYVVTFLSVGWDLTEPRNVTFASNGEERSVNQNLFGNDVGIRIDYSFSATASTRVLTISPDQPGFTFHLYGLVLRQTTAIAEANQYRFDSLNRRVVDGDGVPVAFVEGVVLNQVVDTPDAVEFLFGSSLHFDPSDTVTFTGPKPVRIRVNGDFSLPAGAILNASPTLAGTAAGGGSGGPSVPGGTGGLPMTIHFRYFNNTRAITDPLGHWEELIRRNGHEYVLPRPGAGGAGGNLILPAGAGTKGQPGIGSGVPGAWQGERGPDQDERLWDAPYALAYGYGGPVPRMMELLPGASRGTGAPGGKGWNNPTEPSPGGSGGLFELDCVFALPPACVFFTTEWGSGGAPGSGGALTIPGSPGGNGERGADADHNGKGNGVSGFKGLGGSYPTGTNVIPVLRGGNGGGSGGGGSGGVAGAPGGAGGGGGGGGAGFIGNPGGNGGRGGQGQFGGAGGNGGHGGAGGAGGGAFEISATGNIVIGGTLAARGANGSPGGPGNPGLPGTTVMPGHPEYVVDPIGKPGSPGSNPTGTSPSGAGGRGGDGGEGGYGGNGGAGAGGGGGSGGTIILRGTTVSFTGDPNPAAHIDVSGGTGGEGGIGFGDSANGKPGAFHVVPMPTIALAPAVFRYTINRGESVPDATFTIRNDGPAGSMLHWEMEPPWWITPAARAGSLASGESFNQTLRFDSSVLGGGSWFFSFPVRDASPAALTASRRVTLEFNVNGAPDDHFDDIQGGTVLPATTGVTAQGNLEVGGDSDAFRVNITEPGILEAWTTGNLDTRASLLDATGKAIVAADDQLRDLNFRLVHAVTPGAWFIRVGAVLPNATGAYTLHVNFRPAGSALDVELTTLGENRFLVWDGFTEKRYRVLRSEDLVHWNLDANITYTGTGLPLAHLTKDSSEQAFFRIHEGDLFPVVGFSFRSSSSPPNSAELVSASPGTDVTVGIPANGGDTAVQVATQPLVPESGVLLASAESNPLRTFLVQAPAPPIAVAPPGFPSGHWLATSSVTPDSDNAGVNANAAWFPFAAGWIGGHVVTNMGTLQNFDSTKYFFQTPFLNQVIDDNGEPQIEFNPDRLPLELSQVYTSGQNAEFEDIPLMQGAWISSPAGNNSQPLITGIRPQIIRESFFGLAFYTWKADGTPRCTAPCNVVFVPYDTPNAVVGRVRANGLHDAGSGNYTVDVLGTGHYRIRIPSLGADLRNGTFLVTAYDWRPDCLMTYTHGAGGIEVRANRLPLSTSPTPTPCGFYFVYLPHDRTLFAPGPMRTIGQP